MRHGDPYTAGQLKSSWVLFALRMKWAFLLLFWVTEWSFKIYNM
jgi:hypothetical protein